MDREFLGVYSRTFSKQGKTFYFVWTKNNLYSVQKLDKFFNPIDLLKTIDAVSFKAMFKHEPGMKQIPSANKGVGPKTTLEEVLSPENIENTMRSQFKKTLRKVRRDGLNETNALALKNLVQVEEGIVPEHKHMFSEFGIQLRKGKHLEEALAFCKRTLNLAPTDDHAHFNAARVLMDMGNYDDAEQHLITAQMINPESSIFTKTMNHLSFLRILESEIAQEHNVQDKKK